MKDFEVNLTNGEVIDITADSVLLDSSQEAYFFIVYDGNDNKKRTVAFFERRCVQFIQEILDDDALAELEAKNA